MDTCKVKTIFTDYQDIATVELGLMKGPPASLHLKNGAIPKFYHQPLVSLLRPDRGTPATPAARIQRWVLYLGCYKYKLQFVPGKQLRNSDALSRLPQQTTGEGVEGPTEGNYETGHCHQPGACTSAITDRGEVDPWSCQISDRSTNGNCRGSHCHCQAPRRSGAPTLGFITNVSGHRYDCSWSRVQPGARSQHGHQCNHFLGSGRPS
ncbi:uncharacterized protein [Dermacentor albipictus]|uniref:uncharacterized protein n=1 Tax=Dermacentor albipictus TaxID=60249 RepID=UPI0038FCE5AB